MIRLASLLTIIFYPQICWCCSCGPVDPQSSFESADAVFYASVSGVKQNPAACWQSENGERICIRDYVVSYDTLTLLAGEVPEHESLFTRGGAACGADIEVGREYLFMAYVDNGEIRLSGCGNTIEKNTEQEKYFWKTLKSKLTTETKEMLGVDG